MDFEEGKALHGRLCRARADDRLLHLSDLVACPDNRVSSVILDIVHFLVLPLGTLPDLDLASTANDAHPHSREQVVGSVGVEINTAIEHGGGILAQTAPDESLAAGVFVDEVGHVMNNASDSNQTTAILDLVDVIIPLNDGELVKWDTPVELRALLVKLLLELLNTALLDLVGAELLEVVGKTELAPDPDAPLGRVVLVPGFAFEFGTEGVVRSIRVKCRRAGFGQNKMEVLPLSLSRLQVMCHSLSKDLFKLSLTLLVCYRSSHFVFNLGRHIPAA
jgi:hypothetical protein